MQLDEVALLVGNELGCHGELAGAVNLVLLAAAVEVGHVDAVVVPAAAGLVADTGAAALIACAAVEAGLVARVRSNVSCTGVGLPDVELVTADTLSLDVALKRSVQSCNMERE